VVVTDLSSSAISAPANLFVLVNLSIVQGPLSQTVVAGGIVSLSATINGNPAPFTYEWRRLSPLPLFTNFIISNERMSFYSFAAPLVSATQTWRLVVKNLGNPSPGVAAPTATIIALADSDNDGIPDDWELAHGLSPTNVLDGAIDSDGDGMKNREEYIAGTNPHDLTSCLKVEQFHVSSPAQITFQAISNRTYSVQYTADLNSPAWLKLTDVVARATNRMETVIDANPGTNRFYRIATPQVP